MGWWSACGEIWRPIWLRWRARYKPSLFGGAIWTCRGIWRCHGGVVIMWARIERDQVQEVTDIDPNGRFHPETVWVSCPSDCTAGMGYANGRFSMPVPTAIPPLTRDQIEILRLRAYAHPVTGSDRFFSEATRMNMSGEAGWEDMKNMGISRHMEIQSEYPWPETE